MKKLVDGVLQDLTLEEVVAHQTDITNAATIKAQEIRNKRAALLAESDWTQMPDYNKPHKAEWAIYRQALRNISLQSGFPNSVVWPNKPE